MEEILVLTHRHWWDKANTPYMEYDVYFSYKISFFAFQQYQITSKNKVDELMNEDTDIIYLF